MMQYETVLGVPKEHSFDQIREYIQTDPDVIQFPKRAASFLRDSHVYKQVEANMRNYGHDARQDQARYRSSDEQAPYIPRKTNHLDQIPHETSLWRIRM